MARPRCRTGRGAGWSSPRSGTSGCRSTSPRGTGPGRGRPRGPRATGRSTARWRRRAARPDGWRSRAGCPTRPPASARRRPRARRRRRRRWANSRMCSAVGAPRLHGPTSSASSGVRLASPLRSCVEPNRTSSPDLRNSRRISVYCRWMNRSMVVSTASRDLNDAPTRSPRANPPGHPSWRCRPGSRRRPSPGRCPPGHADVLVAIEEVALRPGVQRRADAEAPEPPGPAPVGDARRVAGVHRAGAGFTPAHPDVPVAVEEVRLRPGVQGGVDAGLAEPGRPPPVGDARRVAGVHRAGAGVAPGHLDVAVALEEVRLRARVEGRADAELTEAGRPPQLAMPAG